LLSNDELMQAVASLPMDQRDCVLMRFVQELSIAETAQVLGRSEGAIKQLQLRAVRGLAKMLSQEAS
jgi:RNA polymerase sigma-70 factor (ECF subfamily)